VPQGKWTQNLLTVAKILGLLAIVAVAIAGPGTPPSSAITESRPFSLALILVLFTFGGWNEMAYVAAEVKNPSRNIVRALVLGSVAVTLLYLLVNAAFLYTLGLNGVANSTAVAADAVASTFPKYGAGLISALICISALGATNGLIFTGARISYAVGAEHRLFRALGRWNPRTGTPLRALLLQGAIAMGLIVLLGSFVNAILYTAAAVYSFYLATNLAVVVLRFKEPNTERPYRVTAYPLPTMIFCAVCAFLIQSAALYKPEVAVGALVILLIGLPIYRLSNRLQGNSSS
jgi:basic amino acid/polyamine antiporter, APA family